MSSILDNPRTRPYSADILPLTKVRLQTSNCPTIIKHEITSPADSFRPFSSTTISDKKFNLERPNTASNTTKMKFAFLQSSRPLMSPGSANTIRPLSGGMNSTINFEFVNGMSKTVKGKLQDHSRIKPVKKLKTDQFHNMIYKIKQQKESLEKDINRMEVWHQSAKENEVWHSPQNTIVDSILKLNARSNPEGNVSRLLETEKELREKESTLRASKRGERPTSAYAHLNKKTPISAAKSVKDFFSEEDDGQKVIEGIIGKSKLFDKKYETNKYKITNKINNYMDNTSIYHTLMHNTKQHFIGAPGMINTRGPKTLDFSLNSKEATCQSVTIEEQLGKSIPEIAESHEQAEVTPTNRPHTTSQFTRVAGFNNTVPEGFRPFSAKVGIHPSLSPKSFSNNGSTMSVIPSQRIPSAIHTRPHTAKQLRMTPSSTLASGLQANGEPRQQSVTNIKFMPFMMQGQKINIEPTSATMNKLNNMTANSKASTLRDDMSHQPMYSPKNSNSTRGLKTTLSNGSFKSVPTRGPESDRVVSKAIIHSRPLTSSNVKATSGTQTWNAEQGTTIGKVNIDGEYFQTFSETNKPYSASFPTRVNKNNNCNKNIQEREML